MLYPLRLKTGEPFAEKYGEKIAESISGKINKLFLLIKRKF
jgi:hypothetical protein